MDDSNKDLTSEPASGQANEAAPIQTVGITSAEAPTKQTVEISVAGKKLSDYKAKVIAALDDELVLANFKFADKERLRFATLKNKFHLKFYQRFQKEGNQVFVLTVKLRVHKRRILAGAT